MRSPVWRPKVRVAPTSAHYATVMSSPDRPWSVTLRNAQIVAEERAIH